MLEPVVSKKKKQQKNQAKETFPLGGICLWTVRCNVRLQKFRTMAPDTSINLKLERGRLWSGTFHSKQRQPGKKDRN